MISMYSLTLFYQPINKLSVLRGLHILLVSNINGAIHPKIKMKYTHTHTHKYIIPKLYDVHSSAKHNKYFELTTISLRIKAFIVT